MSIPHNHPVAGGHHPNEHELHPQGEHDRNIYEGIRDRLEGFTERETQEKSHYDRVEQVFESESLRDKEKGKEKEVEDHNYESVNAAIQEAGEYANPEEAFGGKGEGDHEEQGGSSNNSYQPLPMRDPTVRLVKMESEVRQAANSGYRTMVRFCCAAIVRIVAVGTVSAIGYFIGAMVIARKKENGTLNMSPGNTGGGTPVTPQGLTAKAEGPDRIRVSWSAVAGVSNYRVSRDGVVLPLVGEETFLDTGLATSTRHCYKVAAVNGDLVSPDSEEVCETTLANPLPAPAAPGGLDVKVEAEKALVVTWNRSVGATEYLVRRRLSSASPDSAIQAGVVSEDKPPRFEDSGLETDRQYCYTVTARNESGDSAPSGELCANTWNLCEEGGARAVRDFNDFPEPKFWEAMVIWLDSDPSLDCQINVLLFAHLFTDQPAEPVVKTPADADQLIHGLLEIYDSDPDVPALYSAVSVLKLDGVELSRSEKLDILCRVIARILKSGDGVLP